MPSGQPGLRATINSVTYPIESWKTIQQLQRFSQEWTQGFAGGMGLYKFNGDTSRYHEAIDLDATRSPRVRYRPRFGDGTFPVSVTCTNLDTIAAPVYFFLERSADGTEYLYVLNGQYSWKINAATGSLEETHDHGAGAVCGRPALFEGTWYVPLGATVAFDKLTTIANTGVDTWTADANGDFALAFATGTYEGTAQLARASDTNNVSLSSDGSFSASDQFEVGDTSSTIVDMHGWKGEWVVVKQDGPYVFDGNGNSFPLEEFTGRTNSPADSYDGANSYAHGPYFYWAHRTGLWRFVGDRGSPIGFDTDPDWDTPFTNPVQIAGDGSRWFSVVAFGRWIYASLGQGVFHGYIQNDGAVTWHGALYSTALNTNSVRLGITESPNADEFFLWIAEDGLIRRMRLERDGSTRMRFSTAPGRGTNAGVTTGVFRLPVIDFGEPSKNKQLRRMWVYTDGDWAAGLDVVLSLQYYLNHSTSATQLGTNIVTAGFSERVWTPGTTDTAYFVQPAFTMTSDASYAATQDPGVVAIGIDAVTPAVYEVIIPATVEGLADTAQSVSTVMQALRDLVSSKTISIAEPTAGGPGDTFTGRIVGYWEEALTGGGHARGGGYLVRLHVERVDYGS